MYVRIRSTKRGGENAANDGGLPPAGSWGRPVGPANP